MLRTLLLTAAVTLSCLPLTAADRSPDPVDPAILDAPTVEHLPTLMAALNGSGCAPKHSDVGDALVEIGQPAVAPLVERLNNIEWWPGELECVHLLGLMGDDAKDAEMVLVRYLEDDHHALPQSYARVSLAAVRGDAHGLCDIVESDRINLVPFALELLGQMEPLETVAVIPQLRQIVVSATDRRGTLVEVFLESYDARTARALDSE